MNINHKFKLITLGLAFGLLGSPCAFARPMRHFENGGLSHRKRTLARHVPTEKAFGANADARRPSAGADRDGWPADMILD
jgi:hypothetical protein